MSERTTRATKVVDMQAEFMENCLPGGTKDSIEGPLLDMTRDPYDPRYGHEKFLYRDAPDRSFQGWLRHIAASAMSFTSTMEFFGEVLLTMEMLDEEGLDYLPLTPEMLPSPSGFMLFPYGVENTAHVDQGVKRKMLNLRGEYALHDLDLGCGDRHMVDGFMWHTTDVVAYDGHSGTPTSGISIFPLTKWRGRSDDRPFRSWAAHNPGVKSVPTIVGSDSTSWAFDREGQEEWASPEWLAELAEGGHGDTVEHLAAQRWWIRSLVWSTFRWLTDEVWLEEESDRAARRRFSRAKPVMNERPIEDGKVIIVDLRQERKDAVERGETSGEPPWWRTRWRVRGHYARRRTAILDADGNRVGPVKGPDAVLGVTYRYKRVYIEPFVKGPENAPLVLRDPVGVLNR